MLFYHSIMAYFCHAPIKTNYLFSIFIVIEIFCVSTLQAMYLKNDDPSSNGYVQYLLSKRNPQISKNNKLANSDRVFRDIFNQSQINRKQIYHDLFPDAFNKVSNTDIGKQMADENTNILSNSPQMLQSKKLNKHFGSSTSLSFLFNRRPVPKHKLLKRSILEKKTHLHTSYTNLENTTEAPNKESTTEENYKMFRAFLNMIWSSDQSTTPSNNENNNNNSINIAATSTPDVTSNTTEIDLDKMKTNKNLHESDYTNVKNISRISTKTKHFRKHTKPDNLKDKVLCKTCISAQRLEKAKSKFTESKVRSIRKEMFKEQFLEKMRLDRDELNGLSDTLEKIPPPVLPRDIIQETYRDKARIEEEDNYYAAEEEVIIPADDLGKRMCVSMPSTGCYMIHLAGQIKGQIASAQLWIYKSQDRNDVNPQTYVTYELERKRGKILRRNLVSRMDSGLKQGWLKINVTRTVLRWVEKRRTREMLAVRCKTCFTRNHKSLYGVKYGYKPLLVIKYDVTQRSRYRRSGDFCDPTTDCCKRPLSVNFNDINVPGVMGIQSLNIDYCYGSCATLQHVEYNHTALRQRVRLSSETIDESIREIIKPCCVPVSYKHTFVMTYNGESIRRSFLPNVIVDRCACV